MEIGVFIKACVLYADSGYLTGLKPEELICLYKECLVMAKFLNDNNTERNIYHALGIAYESAYQLVKAVECYLKFLRVSVTTGYRIGEMVACHSLGNAYHLLAKLHEAIKYYEKLLSIAKEIGDKQGEGSAYGNLGNAHHLLGKHHKAIEYHKKQLSIATEIGDRQGEGSAYVCLGIVHKSLGKYQKAIKYLQRCLNIAKEVGDRKAEGTAYGNLGNTYQSLGKYHEAIKYYEKHLKLATEMSDRREEGNAYGDLAVAYGSLGKYYEAIKYQEKCLSIVTETGNRHGEAGACGDLGNAYHSLGKYHEAIKYHEKCLSIVRKIGSRQAEGRACGNLGDAYLLLGRYSEANENYEKQLSIAKEIGDKKSEGNAYKNQGNACLLLGKYQEAVKYYERCLSIATEIGDRRGEGRAYGGLGNAYESLGKYHEAIKYHEKSLSIAMEIGDRREEGFAHYHFGLCYYTYSDSNADRLGKSKEHLCKSIECHELLFDDLKEKDQFKISIFDTFIKSYKILSELCLKTGQTEEALLVSERGRARALGDLLSLKYNMNKETASKSGPLTLSDVNDVMVPTSCVLFYDVPFTKKKPFQIWILAQRKPLWYVASEIPTSTEDKDVKQKEFITNFVKKSYDSIQVREGMAVCEDRSLGVLEKEDFDKDFDKEPAVPESTQIAERGITKGNIEDEKVSAQARCIEDHDDDADDKALESLFAALVAPVQDQLIQEEIVIIPDGPLFAVPFAALKDPKTGKFLSEMKRIRLSPSLTTLKLLQESPDDHHYKSGALIVGNPEIGKVKFGGESFCSLPGAEQEAKEIATLLEVEPLIGKQATKEAVLQKLRVGVSVIHFAAHGSENGQILLAPSPSSATNSIPDEEDYVLTMHDAQESGLRAQLVVLSCCHSGRGEIKAEGVVGMARAFLAAGARAVVASLWAIDDDATKEFMLKFYSHLRKGESACKSLQQAMKEMRETECYKEPKYWAAFFLIGDDVTIRENKEPSKEKGEREIAENE